MGMPAAKQGDRVTAMDVHIIQPPGAPPPPPVPVPHPFSGVLTQQLSTTVRIMGRAAATVDSVAVNTPPHLPLVPGVFVNPPDNRATVRSGSTSVTISGRGAARAGDPAQTCTDPPAILGTVVATGTVRIGG
jgi:uncharacterized Zn-binding protein involved in type VI secretion